MSYKLLYSDFIAFGISVDVDPSVDGDQSVDVDQSVDGDQNVDGDPSVDGEQSDDGGQSDDGDQSSSQAWDYIMQLTLTQSSFYRNLDLTNQMELLAILNNKQSSEDDMIKELEEWYQKQPPQIQTAAKLYLENLIEAYNEIDAHSQQMQANLSPEAKAFLQQEEIDNKDNTENPEQLIEEYGQRFQALPPNVQQEILKYNAQELKFNQQTFNKYLSNRSKRCPIAQNIFNKCL